LCFFIKCKFDILPLALRKCKDENVFNEYDYKKDPNDPAALELQDDPKKSQIVIGLTEADIIKIKEQLATKEVQLDEVRRQQLEQDLARGYTLAQAQAAPKPTLESVYGPSYHMKWRYRGNRHYELDNHLGNVQVVITDKKIAHGSDNWEYYTADILSVHDYYAFGQDIEERSFERGTYRYGFNGKEKQDDIASDDYDFGARIYDARLGRWLGVDPLAAKYASISTYVFVANMPIRAIDPDGRLVILVNGEVGNTPINDNGKYRANASYWSDDFAKTIKEAFHDNNIKFVDGDKGVRASQRYEAGQAFAFKNFENIIKDLAKDKDGKIIESINFVSHSKGGAFASGMVSTIMRPKNWTVI
jgi:RHS repeat-associated protein